MNSTMNYYELLGVKQNANEEEIKKAYKEQMKKWHPDINKSDDAVLISAKINEAKEVLLNAEKRRDYDEYLSKKTEENYNRYTQRKAYEKQEQTSDDEHEEMLTKWQYLKIWLKFANYKPIRKILGVTGVLLESLLCYVIKMLLIFFAFICNIGSYLIRTLFNYLSPIIGLMLVLLVIQIFTNGFEYIMENNKSLLGGVIICVVIYVCSIFLPLLSKLILSPKVFDILYNKIDINLFKKCVGYKD